MHLSPALEEHLEVLKVLAQDGWNTTLNQHASRETHRDKWQAVIDELRFFTSQLRRM